LNKKKISVAFADTKLEGNFESLKSGKFQDKKLFQFMNRAIDDLKKDPASGVKIPKKLWPKSYVKAYNITNLWKYDLPNASRLIYTIKRE
jgi:Txe/YoeB family toxin of Txe-Axe toxin-antitoxin module